MSETDSFLRRSRAAPTVVADPGWEKRFPLREEISIFLELCNAVLLIANTVYAFLELNTSSSLPLKTWLVLLVVQSAAFTIVISIRHAAYLRAHRAFVYLARSSGVATMTRLEDAESLARTSQHHSERIATAWIYSLICTALVLRLYIYVPQSQSALLDNGFDSSQLPTFPQLILGLAFVFEIITFAEYLGRSLTAFLQLVAHYYYNSTFKPTITPAKRS